jgi:hypothetical protein
MGVAAGRERGRAGAPGRAAGLPNGALTTQALTTQALRTRALVIAVAALLVTAGGLWALASPSEPVDDGPAGTAAPPPPTPPGQPDPVPAPPPAAPDPTPPPPDDTPAPEPAPEFTGSAQPLPPDVREAMTGVSWRPGCPVGLDDLALLELGHWGFDGQAHTGRLVVAARVADAVLDAFARIFAAGFPIERMEPVDAYGADDHRSMAANNTSAFNCRPVEGTDRWSEHSFGTAIDINPVQNPYVRGGEVLPPAAAAYRDRSDVRPGMITRAGPVVDAFDAIGWGWGGQWGSAIDYQHFSESGR